MFHLINHPDEYKDGIRIITLVRRRKDKDFQTNSEFDQSKLNIFEQLEFDVNSLPVNAKSNEVSFLTNGVEDFNRTLSKVVMNCNPDQRIYASATPRNLRMSEHKFHQKLLENYLGGEDHRFGFFKNVRNRVASAFGSPETQDRKLWLFDCDTEDEKRMVEDELESAYDRDKAPYWYPTKSGHHCITQTFNKTKLSQNCLSLMITNPQMIWVYYS